jgi:hypothetical protein
MPLIRNIHQGAKTLLYHFHYICKGATPFEIEWNSPELPKSIQRMAELDNSEVKFLSELTVLVREKGKHQPSMTKVV